MLTDSEKRAIWLAVSRSAADRIRARKVFDSALATLGQGGVRELCDALVRQRSLSATAAQELEQGFAARAALPVPILPVAPAVDTDEEPPPRQFGG